ncbi:hypothetical protein PR003_g3431 [Phytophthora rubi]|uniref:Uncharacterized protein n=1 Tax=Phytophthora rubi TaxID=129364 RepID=A0A6A3P2W3_9STRA|nr:hypothetical protein PR002_g3285 [Phytophthora rubi]KAE9049527.1 hypothetical protein PR001_g3248 [Phytophthora rubi]KAE9354310.1 hypothetical protein PR003_g3431 [Phytophthora rubi]
MRAIFRCVLVYYTLLGSTPGGTGRFYLPVDQLDSSQFLSNEITVVYLDPPIGSNSDNH